MAEYCYRGAVGYFADDALLVVIAKYLLESCVRDAWRTSARSGDPEIHFSMHVIWTKCISDRCDSAVLSIVLEGGMVGAGVVPGVCFPIEP